jgi:cytochrome bd-type quinol oxidase subunit 2
MIRALCTIAVLAHLLVSLVHGYAHTELGVGLSAWQNWYVLIVITVAPLVALTLVWTRHRRFGFLLLMVSMAGSLIFGGYYHYVFVSPDHVSHLPPGNSQGLFRLTALILVITEALGLFIGILGLRGVPLSGNVTHLS